MSLERIATYTGPKPLTSLAERYISQTLRGNVAAGQLTVNTPRQEQQVFKGALPGPTANMLIDRPLRLSLRVLARGDIGFRGEFCGRRLAQSRPRRAAGVAADQRRKLK